MEWLTNYEIWAAFLSLTLLEIVLGIDNIVFISIVTNRVKASLRNRARLIGLSLAMILRILLLLSISWIIGLTAPLFSVYGNEISWRDVILLVGGLFLIFKATTEIHNSLLEEEKTQTVAVQTGFFAVLAQICVIDLVFSIDSVITAVGLVDEVPVMIAAIIVAVCVMMVAAKPLSEFVDCHPTVKMLALAFLFLIGIILVMDGLDVHVPKGYIYSALAFSILVEGLNLAFKRQKTGGIKLRKAQFADLVPSDSLNNDAVSLSATSTEGLSPKNE